MKKAVSFLVLLGIVFTMSACSNGKIETTNGNSSESNKASSSQVDSNMVVRKITFPVSQKGKTKFNTKIYDIDPFTVTIALPNGWTTKEAEIPKEGEAKKHFLWSGVWSIVEIFNDANECVGSIGYNTYDVNQSSEDNPITIYNQIALGNGYHFDAKELYKPINKTTITCTAITNVMYSPAFMEGLGLGNQEKINQGILSYDKSLSVYIACELEKDKITNDQLNAIAKSIVFSHAK